MWEWSDKLKVGRAFVKRDLRVLPLTDAEFEADFFLDPVFSTTRQEQMNLMEWSDTMCKGAYPSRKVAVPAYDPTTVVSIHVTAEETETILTQTDIAKTKKLRPRLESMAAEGTSIDLDIHDWSTVLLALCGARAKETAVRKHQLRTATKIANQLADELGIAPPSLHSR